MDGLLRSMARRERAMNMQPLELRTGSDIALSSLLGLYTAVGWVQ